MKRKVVLYFLLITCSGLTAEAAEVRLKAQASASGPPALHGDGADVQDPEKKLAVVYARRNLARGEVIREADVELKAVDAAPRNVQALHELNDAVGQKLASAVGSGEPVDSRCLQRATLVKRGETVTVCSRAQGTCTRTTAKSLEDGGRDDLIMLESLEGKKRFAAKVVGLQEAEVYAAGFHVPRIASTPAPPTPIVKK